MTDEGMNLDPEETPVYNIGGFLRDPMGNTVGEAGAEEASPYDGWKKAELVQEIKNRNADREEADQLDEDGKVSELKQRLEADDTEE